jgi:hypothetical protein
MLVRDMAVGEWGVLVESERLFAVSWDHLAFMPEYPHETVDPQWTCKPVAVYVTDVVPCTYRFDHVRWNYETMPVGGVGEIVGSDRNLVIKIGMGTPNPWIVDLLRTESVWDLRPTFDFRPCAADVAYNYNDEGHKVRVGNTYPEVTTHSHRRACV